MSENKGAVATPQRVLAKLLKPGTKPPPLRAPKKKFKYRTLKEMLFALRFGLMRLGVALVLLIVVMVKANTWVDGLVEEQLGLGAVAKGRVLLRGAQQVASQQLRDFNTQQQATDYLVDTANLSQVAKASGYEVQPIEIALVSLDKNGIIEQFTCVVDYKERRYRIAYDQPGDTATHTLLMELPPSDSNDKK